jgi:hypothetical protein
MKRINKILKNHLMELNKDISEVPILYFYCPSNITNTVYCTPLLNIIHKHYLEILKQFL